MIWRPAAIHFPRQLAFRATLVMVVRVTLSADPAGPVAPEDHVGTAADAAGCAPVSGHDRERIRKISARGLPHFVVERQIAAALLDEGPASRNLTAAEAGPCAADAILCLRVTRRDECRQAKRKRREQCLEHPGFPSWLCGRALSYRRSAHYHTGGTGPHEDHGAGENAATRRYIIMRLQEKSDSAGPHGACRALQDECRCKIKFAGARVIHGTPATALGGQDRHFATVLIANARRKQLPIGPPLPAFLRNTAPKTIAGIVLAPEIAGVARNS